MKEPLSRRNTDKGLPAGQREAAAAEPVRAPSGGSRGVSGPQADLVGLPVQPGEGGAAGPASRQAIQRRIDERKLNVVGEDHRESELRRTTERAFADEKLAPGRYWLEQEFEVESTGDSGGSVRRLADPVDLRLNQRILSLKGNVQRFRERLVAVIGQKTGGAQESAELEASSVILIETAGQIVAEGRRDHEAFRRITLPQVDLPPATDATPVFLRVFQACVADLQLVRGWVKSQALRGKSKREEDFRRAQRTVQFWSKHLDAIRSPEITSGPGQTESELENVNSMRSTLMHRAAVKMEDEVGIWKVGESHVRDIRSWVESNAKEETGRAADRSIPYNLEHKAEFDQEIEEFEGGK